METVANAVAASIGGGVAVVLSFPVTIVATKVQASTDEGSTAVVQKILKEDGIGGLYKGVQAKMMWSMYGKGMYYGAYTALQENYKKYVGELTTLPTFACGYFAEFSHLPVSLPLDIISNYMQLNKGKSFADGIRDIFRDKGMLGFFAGFQAYFLLSLSPALFNTIFTQVKNALLKARGKPASAALGSGESFVLGVLAKATTVSMFYPLMRAIVVQQAATRKNAEGFLSSWQIMWKIYEEQGFTALYRGLVTTVLRDALNTAIGMVLKERLIAATRKALGVVIA